MMRWLIALVPPLLLGCSDKKAPAPPAPAKVQQQPADAATARSDDCAAFVTHLSDRMSALAKTKPGMLPTVIPAEIELATSSSGKPIDAPGMVVVISKDDQVTAGDTTVPLKEGNRLIDEMYIRRAIEAEAMGKGPKKPWPLYVWADKRTKLSSIATLLADTTPRYVTPRLLVTGDPPAPEDAALLERDSVKKVVAGMPSTAQEQLMYRAKHLRDAGDPCSTLPMAYVSYQDDGPVVELTKMAELIPKAVQDCKCNLSDRDVFEYGTLSIAGAFQPSPHWVPLPIDPKDKRTVEQLAK